MATYEQHANNAQDHAHDSIVALGESTDSVHSHLLALAQIEATLAVAAATAELARATAKAGKGTR